MLQARCCGHGVHLTLWHWIMLVPQHCLDLQIHEFKKCSQMWCWLSVANRKIIVHRIQICNSNGWWFMSNTWRLIELHSYGLRALYITGRIWPMEIVTSQTQRIFTWSLAVIDRYTSWFGKAICQNEFLQIHDVNANIAHDQWKLDSPDTTDVQVQDQLALKCVHPLGWLQWRENNITLWNFCPENTCNLTLSASSWFVRM